MKIQVCITPVGELFLKYEMLAFDKVMFNEDDSYHPVVGAFLLEKLGCELLGDL